MKIEKKSDVRRTHILDIAEELFVEKGYQDTSVNEILEAVGIAKGTFYHYFDSKEELIDSIVRRFIDRAVENIKKVAADENLGAVEKIRIIVTRDYSDTISSSERIKEFKAHKNPELQQKKLCYAVKTATPHITKIIEQGIKEGVFNLKYPEAAAELMLVGAMIIFESGGMFNYSPEEYLNRAKAHSEFMDGRFGAAEGTFNFVYEMFKENMEKAQKEAAALQKKN